MYKFLFESAAAPKRPGLAWDTADAAARYNGLGCTDARTLTYGS